MPSSASKTARISRRLYLSHFLSTWNSRSFEFGATLFLAAAFPDSLLQISIYAILRSAAAIFLSAAVGRYIDTGRRLEVVRTSIVVQRLATASSCLLFSLLLSLAPSARHARTAILLLLTALACAEKLASILNLVAVERDWVVVIAEAAVEDGSTTEFGSSGRDEGTSEGLLRTRDLREDGLDNDEERISEGREVTPTQHAEQPANPVLLELNAQMRRIDLFCKLAGPTAIALVDGAAGSRVAVLVTLAMNMFSVPVEYLAIARVYRDVPELSRSKSQTRDRNQQPPGRSRRLRHVPDGLETETETEDEGAGDSGAEWDAPESRGLTHCHTDEEAGHRSPMRSLRITSPNGRSTSSLAALRSTLWSLISSVYVQARVYVSSEAFLPSLALSLLYLNVLSFNGQTVAYLLSAGFASWHVGLLRLCSIAVELSATWAGPLVSRRIGPVRAGIWFLNWELICLALATAYFFPATSSRQASSHDGTNGTAAGLLVTNRDVPVLIAASDGGQSLVPASAVASFAFQHAVHPSPMFPAAAQAGRQSVLIASEVLPHEGRLTVAQPSTHTAALNSSSHSPSGSERRLPGLRALITKLLHGLAHPHIWGRRSPPASAAAASPSIPSIRTSSEARAASSMLPPGSGVLPALVLVCGVVLSRLGLWGFDLSAQCLVQAAVAPAERGSFSTAEAALQNAFELAAFASTAVWSRPADFRFPVLVSVGAVAMAAGVYAAFVRRARGHLIHWPSSCAGAGGVADGKHGRNKRGRIAGRLTPDARPAGELAGGDESEGMLRAADGDEAGDDQGDDDDRR